MKQFCNLVVACLSSALLAACGGNGSFPSSPPMSVAPQRQPMTGSGYRVLYSFGGGTDGNNPSSNLNAVKGTLYGTTYGGGVLGVGTMFSVSTAGRSACFIALTTATARAPTGG